MIIKFLGIRIFFLIYDEASEVSYENLFECYLHFYEMKISVWLIARSRTHFSYLKLIDFFRNPTYYICDIL